MKVTLKRITIYFALAILTMILGMYIFLALSKDPDRFWRSRSNANVTYDGRQLLEANIYGHPDGTLLMNLGEDLGWQVYYPEKKILAFVMRSKTCHFPAIFTPSIVTPNSAPV